MKNLISSLKQENVILFVGAGVSCELGFPSWPSLINKIAEELGYDPEIYNSLGDNYVLAEYYKINKGDIGPMLSSLMNENLSEILKKVKNSNIHKLIV